MLRWVFLAFEVTGAVVGPVLAPFLAGSLQLLDLLDPVRMILLSQFLRVRWGVHFACFPLVVFGGCLPPLDFLPRGWSLLLGR